MGNITDASPSSIYLMHKYWRKKPSLEIKNIVKKYSKKGDLILDPFSGYGGLGIEGVLLDRDVILNDLNPIANFISDCVLDPSIDMKVIEDYFRKIKKEYEQFSKKWYSFKDNKIITILRNNNDEPLKIKLINSNSKKMFEYELNNAEKKDFIDAEKNIKLSYWFPKNKLIKNSRISAKEKMKVSDLFSKRALLCHSYLYKLICELPETNEKKLFKFAFTSNLANCSKLVPPITSRGDMSQGAWMTGFYIGQRYLENNVFYYFENRINKVIKGKKDYIKIYKSKKNTGNYYIKNEDAKRLSIKSNSIDFIFTDFPYGDTVPYFEQSQIWNAWLGFDVDYENEIVISNSSERNKDSDNFSRDIEQAINEISRVLKDKSYFIYTYHSLSGNEWEAISNALLKNDFEFVDCQMLLQKTFTPRQLNRKITIKGDLLVIYKKNKSEKQLSIKKENAKQKIEQEIEREIKKKCRVNELYDTNQLITLCVKCLLKYNHLSNKIDFIDIIKKYFKIDEKNGELWGLKNEL